MSHILSVPEQVPHTRRKAIYIHSETPGLLYLGLPVIPDQPAMASPGVVAGLRISAHNKAAATRSSRPSATKKGA